MTPDYSVLKIAVLDNISITIRSWLQFFKSYQINVQIFQTKEQLILNINQEPLDYLIASSSLLQNLTESEQPELFNLITTKIYAYPKILALKSSKITFIEWPLNEFQQELLLKDLSAVAELKSKTHQLVKEQSIVQILSPFMKFRSNIMKEGLALLPKFAKTPYNVLISGESGTGKELVARAIHFLSSVNKNNFVTINCAAIPEALAESEFFGHEKGAFTGANFKRIGKFQQADNGTLFLDEIGDMPLSIQAKLLRAIEEKNITPVGSNISIAANPRIIAASQINLEYAVTTGKFRLDLYYRINILSIHLPPLRERKEDISLLVVNFIEQSASEMGFILPYPTLDSKAAEYITNQNWTGNVRQLKNFITKLIASIPSETKIITPELVAKVINLNNQIVKDEFNYFDNIKNQSNSIVNEKNNSVSLDNINNQTISTADVKNHYLSADIINNQPNNFIKIPQNATIAQAKIIMLKNALKNSNGNKTKAAKILGISVRHLARMLTAEL